MENTEHGKWFEQAAEVARQSKCLKAKCGAILVANNQIIGKGFNSPAGGEPNRCLDEYIIPENNKHNVTCCPHAEVRAIHDALLNFPGLIKDSTLYFMRVNSNDEQTFAGVPYCTTCSSEALDSGVKYFALLYSDGAKIFPTAEYNNVSYNYFKDTTLWQFK